jgi:asparagine synthase (glutamine-hydrolysing)
MCGITGALTFKNSPFKVTESLITQMRDTMIHRGPDGAGTWVAKDGRIGLGHRRLSIIDVSDTAAQPMCNEDQSLWLTFNGEIYNHAEIRSELETTGKYKWKTDHSDTEVILHAFEEWGIDCIHKFRGMFAFAIWDTIKKELWLVRDRIGIKPLYYSIHHGRITFASEIKALLKDPEQKRAVHEEAFFHYLSFLTTPAPQTMFEGIKKLAGGTWLRINESGEIRENRYWDVWDHTTPMTGISEDEIASRLLDELRTSVKYRKVSDVPVGVFLSGGIDSSTNTALFAEDNPQPVKTFSIGYDQDYKSYQNELTFARLMAKTANAEYHEKLLCQEDLINFLPEMIHLQDEPIADPVCVPVYYVSKLARENGVIVCQVGEGADELFWGYEGWKTSLNLQKANDWPVPKFIKNMGLAGLSLLNRKNTYYYEWLNRGTNDLPVFWGGAEAFTHEQKLKLLSPRLRKQFAGYSSWEAIKPIRKRFEEKAWDKSHLNWMSYLDLNFRLPELLLMRVDKMSMGVSLEARVPFLDHKFVEMSMSIPESLKTKNETLKYILKKSVRGLIPDELIDRKKQGFGVPVYDWLYGELGDTIHSELEEFCKQTDFFDWKELNNNTMKNSVQLWYLFNFSRWWRNFIL